MYGKRRHRRDRACTTYRTIYHGTTTGILRDRDHVTTARPPPVRNVPAAPTKPKRVWKQRANDSRGDANLFSLWSLSVSRDTRGERGERGVTQRVRIYRCGLRQHPDTAIVHYVSCRIAERRVVRGRCESKFNGLYLTLFFKISPRTLPSVYRHSNIVYKAPLRRVSSPLSEAPQNSLQLACAAPCAAPRTSFLQSQSSSSCSRRHRSCSPSPRCSGASSKRMLSTILAFRPLLCFSASRRSRRADACASPAACIASRCARLAVDRRRKTRLYRGAEQRTTAWRTCGPPAMPSTQSTEPRGSAMRAPPSQLPSPPTNASPKTVSCAERRLRGGSVRARHTAAKEIQTHRAP